jgi:site-specific DNA-methyltransferase (adenine-specific)
MADPVIIGDCTLYLGDCRDILPTLRAVDAIICDPVWPNVPADLIAGSDRPFELFAEFCAVIPSSVCRIAIEMRNDSDPRFLAPIPSRFEFIQVMWCQYAMPGYLGRVLGGNETVYVYGEPIRSQEGRRVIPSVSPKAQPGDRPPNGHPCSRALVHQEFVVNWCSDNGELVCDPLMGSGTTGVACVKLGRKFIGIEIEPKYFDIACRRIEDAVSRPDMFIEAAKQPTQTSLLDEAAA